MNKYYLTLNLFVALVVTAGCGAPAKVVSVRSEGEKEKIHQALLSARKEMSTCYSITQKKSPELKGRVLLSWSVDNKGEVGNAKVKDSNIKDDKGFSDCMIGVISKTKFPPAPKGQFAEVAYPFVLGSESKAPRGRQ